MLFRMRSILKILVHCFKIIDFCPPRFQIGTPCNGMMVGPLVHEDTLVMVQSFYLQRYRAGFGVGLKLERSEKMRQGDDGLEKFWTALAPAGFGGLAPPPGIPRAIDPVISAIPLDIMTSESIFSLLNVS